MRIRENFFKINTVYIYCESLTIVAARDLNINQEYNHVDFFRYVIIESFSLM